jgi:aryl-alcohol dehydrogenase-like predicted oxidoreductase
LGATKKTQLEENLKALQVLPLLTTEVMGKIENILQNKPVMDLA